MYINDYSNRWAYWFGTAAIQHTEFNSAESTKTGNGSITAGAGNLGTPSNWSGTYSSAFLSALRALPENSITSPALAALNSGGDPSAFFPLLKLKSKLGGSDIYIKLPLSMIPNDAATVRDLSGASVNIYYGRYQNTDTSRLITNYGFTDPQVAYNIPFNQTLNAFYVDAGGWGIDEGTVTIDNLTYRCLIDNDNGNLGLTFRLTFTIEGDGESITETMGWFNIILSLGSAAYAYGFEEQEGGLYPVPDSIIPLKDVLNAHGTDFNHAIDIYDETRQDVNNMFLVNYVGTIAYTFVKFDSPVGTIRCYTPMQFTHFVTRSFTDNDTPRVYRVTKWRVLNTNVIEYDFVVDYLKDYWQHFGISNDNAPFLMRSTYAGVYNKLLADDLPYNGRMIRSQITTNMDVCVCIVLGQVSSIIADEDIVTGYAMTLEEYRQFLLWWRTDQQAIQYQGAIANLIQGVYIMPFGASSIYRLETDGTIGFFLKDANVTVTYAAHSNIYRCQTNDVGYTGIANYVEVEFTNSDTTLFTDSRFFNTEVIAHLPCYGDISVPKYALVKLADTGILDVRYMLNINDGSVAVSFQPYNIILDAVALPSLQIPINTAASAIRNVERSREQMYVSAGLSAAGKVLSGNFGGLLDVGAGVINSGVSIKNQIANIQETEGSKSFSSSGMISIGEKPTLKFNYPDLTMSIDEYYSRIGYPTFGLWISATAGERYWIELQNDIRGTEEYVNGVKAAINGRGIVYNYT